MYTVQGYPHTCMRDFIRQYLVYIVIDRSVQSSSIMLTYLPDANTVNSSSMSEGKETPGIAFNC